MPTRVGTRKSAYWHSLDQDLVRGECRAGLRKGFVRPGPRLRPGGESGTRSGVGPRRQLLEHLPCKVAVTEQKESG